MASDAGSGTGPALGWPFGGIVDVVQDTVGDLVTELESFTKFRNRIDELVEDLKASPADAKKLNEVFIGETQFGAPAWAEATGLFSSYQKVITELETFSKLLSDSMEGMGIAVLASHKGYENLDDDIRQRMLAIREGAQEHYKGEYDPQPEGGKGEAGKPAAAPEPSPTEQSGGSWQ
ncbi:hypothetical protein ABT185_13970 [Streptomyces clavifer]|uniref:hypothetical protein n=1 Tax=Streptomyces clavifer TaxID=68188 RepID=UPI00332EA09F